MIRYVVGAGVAVLLGAAWWFACDGAVGQEQIAYQDSIAKAKRQAVQETRQRLMPKIQQWRDSSSVYKKRYAEAKQDLEEADRDFEDNLDQLIADAEAGEVTAPQLESLGEVHVEVVQACQRALSACEADLSTTENRLGVYRDSIVPALEASQQAERSLAETAKRVASPSLFTRIGRNLELLGIGAVVGGTTICILSSCLGG